MKVYPDIIKLRAKKPVVTIGVFDGVHEGHHLILNKCLEKAKKIGGESVVITFWPHPKLILGKDPHKLKYLNTLEEKQILLEKSGIDHLIIIPFTKKFAGLSAKKFIKKYLVKKIKLKYIIVGYNHQFGKKRKGNFKLLEKYAEKYHFGVEQLDAKIIEKESVSSTVIRRSLDKGDLITANKYLGYDYLIRGTIIKGKKIGSKIGFPTANIEVNDNNKLIPKDGVYAVFVTYNNRVYKGMLNIGIRPTIDDRIKQKIIEVHIIDFNEDIYNKKITFIFVARIRDEKKFRNIEELKSQLLKDKGKILEVLNNKKESLFINNNLYHERNNG